MKRMLFWSKALIVFFVLTLSLQSAVLALTQKPKLDNEGNFQGNQFAESDAYRYGGLFGPLPEPDPYENWEIAINNPQLVNPIGGMATELEIYSRDLGFGTSNDRYKAINRSDSSSS